MRRRRRLGPPRLRNGHGLRSGHRPNRPRKRRRRSGGQGRHDQHHDHRDADDGAPYETHSRPSPSGFGAPRAETSLVHSATRPRQPTSGAMKADWGDRGLNGQTEQRCRPCMPGVQLTTTILMPLSGLDHMFRFCPKRCNPGREPRSSAATRGPTHIGRRIRRYHTSRPVGRCCRVRAGGAVVCDRARGELGAAVGDGPAEDLTLTAAEPFADGGDAVKEIGRPLPGSLYLCPSRR